MKFNPELLDKENALLAELQDPSIASSLVVATMADVQVGTVLYYPSAPNGWGCHTVQAGGYAEDPETKLPLNDMRGGIEAGRFYIRKDKQS